VSGAAKAVGLAGVNVGLLISSIGMLGRWYFLKGESLNTFDSNFAMGF